jgi:hypothetical protein
MRLASELLLSCAMIAGGLPALAQPPKKNGETPEKIEPRFEPREKFDAEGSLRKAYSAAPPCGDLLYAGQRGTFHLLGPAGEASFSWPIDGRPAKSYQEHMVFLYRTEEVAVYKLVGQFYRVYFAFNVRQDEPEPHPVWIKNGDAPWREFQAATAGPPRR